jgi:hypothetical protein
MFKFSFTKLELSIICLVFFLILLGLILSFTNLEFFLDHYIIEDGFIEWLTVVGLLFGAGVCFTRAKRLYTSRGFLFSLFTISLGILMIIAAGEEISWGQRIIGIESSDYFKDNNSQQEMNFHNLVINGVRINTLVFSLILISSLSIYMIIVPYFYRKNTWVQNFLDSKGIILPKTYQTISVLLVFAMTTLIPHGKKAELLEFGAVFIFLLIVFYPLNEHIFHKNKSIEKDRS